MRASRKKRRKMWREKLSTMTNAIKERRARPIVMWPKWAHYAENRTTPSIAVTMAVSAQSMIPASA